VICVAAEMGGSSVLARLAVIDLERRTIVTCVGSFARGRYVAQMVATISRDVLLSTALASLLLTWQMDPVRARYWVEQHYYHGVVAEYCIASTGPCHRPGIQVEQHL